MKLVRVDALFEIQYGTSLELNALTPRADGIPFVSRTTKNNGVSEFVAPVQGVEPLPGGTLTVALGGTPMTTFLQEKPFYSGRDVAYLTPRKAMTRDAMLYYATCLQANRRRFSFGRQANRSLPGLLVPAIAEVPSWVDGALDAKVQWVAHKLTELGNLDRRANTSFVPGPRKSDSRALPDSVPVHELFTVDSGTSLELNALRERVDGVAFVSRTTQNNGISARVSPPKGAKLEAAGALTVALSGSPLTTFLQEEPFYTGYHVAVLRPKVPMARNVLLYYVACLQANRYRYSFGRQANRTLSMLRVPALHKVPTWVQGGFSRVADGLLKQYLSN